MSSPLRRVLLIFPLASIVPVLFSTLLYFSSPHCGAQTLPTYVGPPSQSMQLPIPGAGHDYIQELSETVNPANGTLTIRIAFPVPRGRGITVPFQVQYNSGEPSTIVSNPINGALDWSSTGWPTQGIAQGNGWGATGPIPLSGSGSMFNVTAPSQCPPNYPGCGAYPLNCNFAAGFSFTDLNQTTHTLPIGAEVPNGNANPTQCAAGNVSLPAGDTQVVAALGPNTLTGLAQNPMQPISVSVLGKEGNSYNFLVPGGSSAPVLTSMEDRNGNYLSATDTAGRTLPTDVSNVFGIFYSETGTTTQVNYAVPLTFVRANLGADVVYCASGSDLATNSATISVISTLNLPNKLQYQFLYNDPYGLVSEIIYPNGGWVKYNWVLPTINTTTINTKSSNFAGQDTTSNYSINSGCSWYYPTPVVQSRQVSYDGSTVAETQTFTYGVQWTNGNQGDWTSKTATVTTTDNVLSGAKGATYSSVTNYTYVGSAGVGGPYINSCNDCVAPVESSVQRFDWGNTTTPVDTETKAWYNPFQLACDFHTVNGQTAGHFYSYAYGLISDDKEFGFGQITNPASICTGSYPVAPTSPLPMRETVTTFQQMTSPMPPHLTFAEPSTVIVKSLSGGSQIPVSETDYGYDEVAIVTAGKPTNITNHDEAIFGPTIQSGRGNITSITKKCFGGNTSCSGNSITRFSYDETGQVASMTDGCGNVPCTDMRGGASHTTLYSFADAYSDQNPAGGQNSNTYLTAISYPTVNVGMQRSFTYSYMQGEVTSSTDENHQTSNYIYADPLDRITQVTGPPDPNNGNQRPTTNTYYDDAHASTTVSQILNTSGITKSTTSYRDGLGHVTRTSTTDPTSPSGLDSVDTKYYGLSEVWMVSNPYFTTAANWTTDYYDGLGRKTVQQMPDGAVQQWCYNGISSTGQSNCNPHLKAIAGTWVDFQDGDGNDWQRTSDSFGRLVQVFEPNGTSRTPSIETDYTYNGLNDLVSVNQIGNSLSETPRSRIFSYDSLGELQSSNNPETGNTTYKYDANGNLWSKTDARTVTTSYSYDALNRLIMKSYSDASSAATPWSCYQYDSVSVANGVGRLSNQWTQSASVGACAASAPSTGFWTKRSILAYDVMGHLSKEQQFTPASKASGTAYAPAYTYDLAGNLLTSTDGTTPSPTTQGAMLTFGYTRDSAEHLLTVTSNWVDPLHPSPLFSAQAGPTTLPCGSSSSTAPYAAFGGLMNATFGPGLTLNRGYDVRLRMNCEIDIGTAPATSGSTTVGITGAEQIK